MPQEQAPQALRKLPPYHGVYWHKPSKRYRAAIRLGNREISLGYFADPELAAYVVDTALYLVHGLDVAKWDHRTPRPNGPPRMRDDYDRLHIVLAIMRSGLVRTERLARHLAAFDVAVATDQTELPCPL